MCDGGHMPGHTGPRSPPVQALALQQRRAAGASYNHMRDGRVSSQVAGDTVGGLCSLLRCASEKLCSRCEKSYFPAQQPYALPDGRNQA